MARRGFFAELQHQGKVAAREAERAQAARARQHSAAIRRAEQSQRALERATTQAARSASAYDKQMEKEAKEAHAATMEADADERNAELEQIYREIDSLLAATLEVDDYVDLENSVAPPSTRRSTGQTLRPPRHPRH